MKAMISGLKAEAPALWPGLLLLAYTFKCSRLTITHDRSIFFRYVVGMVRVAGIFRVLGA